jgi:hypothetical protein
VAARASETLSVERMSVRCDVSTTHPDPARVRARLDRCLQGHLGGCLAAAAGRLLADTSGLWFVRRLPVELDVDAALPADVMGQTLARSIVVALARETVDGDADNVVHFADRADYLARFADDCARGEAWQRWYYRGLDGLRLLSSSSAIATTFAADIEDGARALQRLDASDLKHVVATLSTGDARHLLDAMSAPTPSAPDATIWRAALASWRVSRHAGAASKEQRALLILAGIRLADTDALADAPLRDACCIAARTLAALHGLATQGEMLEFTESGADAAGHRDAIRALLPADLRRLGASMPEPAVLLAAMVDRPVRTVDTASACTPFGGLFLLLEALDDGGLDGTEPFDAVLRLSVLACCLGGECYASAMRDPAWRRLLGVDARADARELAARLRAAGSAVRRRLEHACLAPTFGSRGQAWQLVSANANADANQNDGAAHTWIVADDRALWSAIVSFVTPRRAARRLRLALHDWPAERLLAATPAQAPRLADALPAVLVEQRDDSAPGTFAKDLDYLGAPCDPWDALVTLLAARVLRRFAERLPGFATASFAYLHANCLDVSAEIEWQDERVLVHLERPPLDLILNLAGANRGERRLDWLPGPPLALFAGR